MAHDCTGPTSQGKGCEHGYERAVALFAWVADVGDGMHEGVIACTVPPLGMTPLVAADIKTAEKMRPWAQAVADKFGRPTRLVRFSTRDELIELTPAEPDPLTPRGIG